MRKCLLFLIILILTLGGVSAFAEAPKGVGMWTSTTGIESITVNQVDDKVEFVPVYSQMPEQTKTSFVLHYKYIPTISGYDNQLTFYPLISFQLGNGKNWSDINSHVVCKVGAKITNNAGVYVNQGEAKRSDLVLYDVVETSPDLSKFSLLGSGVSLSVLDGESKLGGMQITIDIEISDIERFTVSSVSIMPVILDGKLPTFNQELLGVVKKINFDFDLKLQKIIDLLGKAVIKPDTSDSDSFDKVLNDLDRVDQQQGSNLLEGTTQLNDLVNKGQKVEGNKLGNIAKTLYILPNAFTGEVGAIMYTCILLSIIIKVVL